MDFYERERIIAECRKKLPYPVSFYDKLSDGSLWNVYNKHVVNNIPINKRGQKAKAENDIARAQEALNKAQKEKEILYDMSGGTIPTNDEFYQSEAEREYYQMTIEEYMASLQPEKPKLVRSTNGSWWRLTDAGTYDWVPDSELDDVLEAFGVEVASEPEPEQEYTKKLTRNPGRR